MTEALSWGATRAPLFVGLALLLGLSAVGTLSARQRTRALSLDTLRPASVPHTFILPDEASGTLLVRSTLVDVEAPEQRSWLRLQEARGLRVTRLGPGSYLVAPGNSGH